MRAPLSGYCAAAVIRLRLMISMRVMLACHMPGQSAGIQDAIERNYLKTMMFGISVDADGTKLLEVQL